MVNNDGTRTFIDKLYLYDGAETSEIYSTTIDGIALSGIQNLAIEGNHVVWTERYRTPDFGAGDNLYLYDLDSNSAEPILLNDDGLDSNGIRFGLAGENIAWLTNSSVPANIEPRIFVQDQLYAYRDGAITQLSSLELIQGNRIVDFEVLDSGVLWSSSSKAASEDDPLLREVFFATTNGNEEQEEETPDPVDFQEGLDRWWATAGSEPIEVNWTINVEQSGTYELDIDGLSFFQGWRLTDDATVSVTVVDELGDFVTFADRSEFD